MLPSGTVNPCRFTATSLTHGLKAYWSTSIDDRDVADVLLDDPLGLLVDLQPRLGIGLGLALVDQIVELRVRPRLALSGGLLAVEHVAVAVVRIRVVVPPANPDELELVLEELRSPGRLRPDLDIDVHAQVFLKLGDDVVRHQVGVVDLLLHRACAS